MFATHFPLDGQGEGPQHDLFESIATDIQGRGYSIKPNGLPMALAEALWGHLQSMSAQQFDRAGIGRDDAYALNSFVRTDEICWITGESRAGQQWLNWMAVLQHYLNRRLLLGLFSFESHFAHYAPGDFYKRHLDAFKGGANRILSVVVYLNPGWQPVDGGELVIYTDEVDQDSIRVTPAFGTLVVFLSEDFPHEVLPAQRDRYSIAGWFRLNTSTSDRVDPPR
jgi:SM-20-related protein